MKNLKQIIGILEWLPEYKKPGVIRADLLAGLTGAIVVLPQGFAFAILAGMPPHYGLYTAIIPCIIAALFGSSRLMVTGPANAISLTTLVLIAPFAQPESPEFIILAITLSFFVGVAQFILGLVGAGKLIERIPHSVIVGFTAGAALLIINSQVATLLGIAIPKGSSILFTINSVYKSFIENSWHFEGLILVTLTLVTLRIWKRFNKIVPAMLIAVIIGSIAAICMEYLFSNSGLNISRVTGVPSPLPPLSIPDISISNLKSLAVPIFVMLLLASTEAMAIARAVALKNQESFNANQEFRGQGLANIAGAFFSAYPSSGSFNRSGINMASGAKTPLAAISSAFFLILILAFLSDLAIFIPYAVIAALLFYVAWGLININEIQKEFKSGPLNWMPMLVTFLGTIFFSLEWAIVAGVGLVLLSNCYLYIKR